MSKYQTKTRQEKNELFIENGDFNRLLINNQLFILKIAKSFKQPEYIDDLIQEGNIALHKAFTTFKPELGKPFLGYAKPIITNQMKSWLRIHSNVIRTPTNLIGSDDLIQTISISTPVDENNTPLSEFIPSQVSTTQNDTSIVKMAVMTLEKDTDKKILMMWLGLDNELNEIVPMTYQDISDELGCTRENIRQKINKVLKQLQTNEKIQKAYQAFKRD